MNNKAHEGAGTGGAIAAVIIDDEPKAVAMLRSLVADHCPRLRVVGDAGRVDQAVEVIKATRPQLVFLDVDLTGATGFDLLERIEDRSFHVVLVTAHPEFAVKAFRYSVIDYLMKPVDEVELQQAVSKVADRLSREELRTRAGGEERNARHTLRIPSMEGARFVPLDDIIRLEAEGAYTRIQAVGERHMSSYNLKHFEEHLDKGRFLRVHRSHVVNMAHVKALHSHGGLVVELSDGSRIPVSRSYRAAVQAVMR